MLCYFQVYSKVIQLFIYIYIYIYIYIFSFRFFSVIEKNNFVHYLVQDSE